MTDPGASFDCLGFAAWIAILLGLVLLLGSKDNKDEQNCGSWRSAC